MNKAGPHTHPTRGLTPGAGGRRSGRIGSVAAHVEHPVEGQNRCARASARPHVEARTPLSVIPPCGGADTHYPVVHAAICPPDAVVGPAGGGFEVPFFPDLHAVWGAGPQLPVRRALRSGGTGDEGKKKSEASPRKQSLHEPTFPRVAFCLT